MVREIQYINPAGLNDPSNYGYTHVTVVPCQEELLELMQEFDQYPVP